MIISIINCILLFLSGVTWDTKGWALVLKGAYAMAENEIKIVEANVQKVIARLKAL